MLNWSHPSCSCCSPGVNLPSLIDEQPHTQVVKHLDLHQSLSLSHTSAHLTCSALAMRRLVHIQVSQVYQVAGSHPSPISGLPDPEMLMKIRPIQPAIFSSLATNTNLTRWVVGGLIEVTHKHLYTCSGTLDPYPRCSAYRNQLFNDSLLKLIDRSDQK